MHRAGILLLSGAVALTATLHSSPAAAVEDIKLLLGWIPSSGDAGLYYAKQKGMYEAAGIRLNIHDGQGTTVTANVIANGGGGYDAGVVAGAVTATVIGKGAPIRVISQYMPGTDLGIFVTEASGARTIKDFETKKLSLVYGTTSIAAPFMDVLLKNGGSSRDKIRLIGVAAQAAVGTYLAGKGDAVIGSYPFMASLLKDKPSYLIRVDDYGLALPGFGIVATEESIKKRGPALRSFIQVTAKAWEEVAASPAAVKQAVAAMVTDRPDAKLDPVQLEAQLVQYVPLLRTANTASKPIGWNAEKDWAATVAILQQVGMLDARYKAADMYTNQFFE